MPAGILPADLESIPLDNSAAAASSISRDGDQADEPEATEHKKSWKIPKISKKGRRALAAFIVFLAAAVYVGCFIGFRLSRNNYKSIFANSVDICSNTLYPTACNDTLFGTDTTNPPVVVSKSVEASLESTNETYLNLTRCRDSWPLPRIGIQFSTLKMCVEMYQDTLDATTSCLHAVESSEGTQVGDLQRTLSAALTYHFTCVDGLQEHKVPCEVNFQKDTELLSNALSLLQRLNNSDAEGTPLPFRRLLAALETPTAASILTPTKQSTLLETSDSNHDLLPTWLSKRDRQLLASTSSVTPDTVVALDGSGDYKSIQTAIDEAPTNSSKRHVIRIKAGVYVEQVKVPKDKTNLTMLGDGAGITIITGNRSVAIDRTSPIFTATVTVIGNGFVAKDLTIRNTAGPSTEQAMALRATSHQSAFSNVSIEGYRNALYAHANWQFYTFCTIVGTVDLVFGSAAAVFQHCTLRAQPPNPGDTITFTASDIASPLVQRFAGLVFDACLIDAASDLVQAGTAFLGRPRHLYAKTMYIKSSMGKVVTAKGWTLWNAKISSICHVDYGEYANFGPGSDVKLRAPWSRILYPEEAKKFGADEFLQGRRWLPNRDIAYTGSI